MIRQLRNDGLTLRTVAAVCGLCGGIGVGVLGSIISAIAWFTGPEWHGHLLRRDGTILLFLTIPLLIFGAHCLDLVDRQQTKNQKSRLVLIAFVLLSGAGVAEAQEAVSKRERLLLERVDRLERKPAELDTRVLRTGTDRTPEETASVRPEREGPSFLAGARPGVVRPQGRNVVRK